jgi:hypothetical protein
MGAPALGHKTGWANPEKSRLTNDLLIEQAISLDPVIEITGK